MRVNAEELDNITRYCQVHLNGVDISNICVEADDGGGWVRVVIPVDMRKDAESGRPIFGTILADEDGKPLVQTINGKIEISMMPDTPDEVRAEFEERRR